MSTPQALPRQTKPELEHAYSRSPELGYEPPETAGFFAYTLVKAKSNRNRASSPADKFLRVGGAALFLRKEGRSRFDIELEKTHIVFARRLKRNR